MRARSILFCVAAGLVSVAPLHGAVTVDFTRDAGAMKPLHGLNNSPNRLRGALPEFAAAGIPYARPSIFSRGISTCAKVQVPVRS